MECTIYDISLQDPNSFRASSITAHHDRLRSPQHLKQASEITTLALRVNNCELVQICNPLRSTE